ncbi:thiazole synthase [Spirochaeta thermophila]|uniref:Thiazole synthase n=1 Tax=Winmispira thermophila (strain ATCC 49972 / DSM 6192 / RI 19.B1) TaxID=665571 RepID=E0RNC3_WINT6|nr:thiazole synthase [Spirochaeta thermophila]ADN01123.1 thiazole biosynthesis protein ThiG [Spirochaeta thermophila DSM 6192]
MDDSLVIGGTSLESRLVLGTGKFPDRRLIPRVIAESGAQVVTVALRRVNLANPEDNVLSYIPKGVVVMPNTSGARCAEEAVRIARLARAAGCGNWVKVEIVPDQVYLMPDNQETLRATEILVKEGFVVLPYVLPDLVIGRKLQDAGAAAVMPLGAPIGSNRGLKTAELIRMLVEELEVPIIVDAGIGKPSEAAAAMEMGCAAVLVNTAIATAGDPVGMARAFALAVEAGRRAFLAGLGPVREYAEASSPLTGFLQELEQPT